MREFRPPDLMARRIAAYGLRGDGDEQPFSVPEGTWPMLLANLYDQRLTGLATQGVERGWVDLTTKQRDELLARFRDAMFQALALERNLVNLSVDFERAEVEMVVVKGPALAHTMYPDPSWRPFADIDLVVRGRDFRRACELLEQRGYRRDLPEPRAGFDLRFGKAAEYAGPDGLTVDLHRTLVVGPFGLWVDPDELLEQTTPFSLGGRRLQRLDDTSLLLHACMHASLGWWPPLLMPVRDVAQVASVGRVDWDVAADRMRRWKLTAVVRHAFQTATETLAVALPAESKALTAVLPRRKEHRALQAYVTERRGRGGTVTSTLKAIPGLRAKAAYVRALLFPTRDFLAARHRNGRPSYLRRLAVPLRWLTVRRRGAS